MCGAAGHPVRCRLVAVGALTIGAALQIRGGRRGRWRCVLDGPRLCCPHVRPPRRRRAHPRGPRRLLVRGRGLRAGRAGADAGGRQRPEQRRPAPRHPLVRPEAAVRRAAEADPPAPVPRPGSGDRPVLPRALRREGAPGGRAVRRARRARLRLDRPVAQARLRGRRERRLRHRPAPRRLDAVRLLSPPVVDARDLHDADGGGAAGGVLRRPAARAGRPEADGRVRLADHGAGDRARVHRDPRRRWERGVRPRHDRCRGSTRSPRTRTWTAASSSSPTSGASCTRTSGTTWGRSR